MSQVSNEKYIELASRTFKERDQGVLDRLFDQANSLHCVIGVETEAGELLDAFKKHVWYGKSLDDINIQEEIGDLMWYIANLCRIRGYDFQQILEANINKLKTRYPDKFDEDKAINRNLTEETKTLNNDLGNNH